MPNRITSARKNFGTKGSDLGIRLAVGAAGDYKVAQNDFASSKEQLEASKYIVSSTEASVKESRENVRKTSVVAPLTGVVSKLSVKQGERVGCGNCADDRYREMLRIADLSKMEVRVNVSENDIVRVHFATTPC